METTFEDKKLILQILRYKYYIRLLKEYNDKAAIKVNHEIIVSDKCKTYRDKIKPGLYYSWEVINIKKPRYLIRSFLHRILATVTAIFFVPFMHLLQLYISYGNQFGYIAAHGEEYVCYKAEIPDGNLKKVLALTKLKLIMTFAAGYILARFLQSLFITYVIILINILIAAAQSLLICLLIISSPVLLTTLLIKRLRQ